MRSLLKVLLGIIAAVIVLVVVAAIALPFIYDTDDLKREIAAQVKKQTGREFSINGELKFSVFPWLAVEVNDLALGNAAGFGQQPFARVEKARAGVLLMPLLRKELAADEITLAGLQLNLQVNTGGGNNWDDLANRGESADEPTDTPASFSSQRIAGLNIVDGLIELDDKQAGSQYRLSNITLKTGALGEGEPIPVELTLLLEDLVAKSAMQVDLEAVTAMDFKARTFGFEGFELTLGMQQADGNDRSLVFKAPRADADLQAQTFAMEGFELLVGPIRADGNLNVRKLIDAPAFNGVINFDRFDPGQLMEELGMEKPITADPKVMSQARMSMAYQGNAEHVSFTELSLDLDQSQLRGDMSVRNFDQPRIRFELDINAIDLDRYSAPVAKNADGSDGPAAMPRDEIRGLNLNGTLRVGELKVAGLTLNKAVVGVTVKNNRLQLSPLTAQLYDGNYSGNIGVDASGDAPVVSLDEKLDSVTFAKLAEALADQRDLSGLAEGHLKVSGRGITSTEVLSTLKGNLGLTLTDGALEGINVWYEIRSAMARLKGKAAPPAEPDRTVFSRMQFDGGVNNGVVNTRKIEGDLPFMKLTGDGAINLLQGQLNLQLLAAIRNTPEMAADPLVSDLVGRKVPLKITGAITDPKISVDFGSILKDKATDKLIDKLGLGEPAAPAEGEEAKADPKKDAARSLLKGLLGGSKDEPPPEDDGDGD